MVGRDMNITLDGNMASARVGSLWLAATGNRPIEDATWREYLEQAAASVRQVGPFTGILLWAPTFGPSTHQRRMLTDEFGEAVRVDAQRRVALISESAFVRGTMTAINWLLQKNILAFAPPNIERALEWLAEEIAFDPVEARATLDGIVAAVRTVLRKQATS